MNEEVVTNVEVSTAVMGMFVNPLPSPLNEPLKDPVAAITFRVFNLELFSIYKPLPLIVPLTSNEEDGKVLFTPTLLLVESTYNTPPSTFSPPKLSWADVVLPASVISWRVWVWSSNVSNAFWTVSSAPDNFPLKLDVLVNILLALPDGITETGTGNNVLTGVIPPNWNS